MADRVVGCLLLALMLAACAGSGSAAPTTGRTASSDALAGTVTVFAAASLTDAFEAIGERFEQAHPDVDVAFNFASSSTLATQITEGAPADVFASADQAQMDVVDDAGGIVGERVDIARNSLQIAVEPGNPMGIAGLDDLARADVTVVLAAEEVPAGEYARQVLDAQRVAVDPASLETDVRAVLSRVALGEADAGVVYTSDVESADGAVEGVVIPPDRNVAVTYPIATVTDAPNPAAADAFAGHVTSDEGLALLRAAGFSAP
ncbi:MAG TPA: molybdate ABC transporter substrate-binding protein [Euzebyales bacterium]